MGIRDLVLPALTLALAASPAAARDRGASWEVGRLVSVSVERHGEALPLYAAPDGSGRRYLEARRGESYAVRLTNRTPRRLGVELRVDGLDVISGQAVPARERGRLYILEPWGSTLVRGWRSSLHEIHRFTFVDEARSYAARRHEPAARLGWIETRVFEERRSPPRVSRDSAARGRASAPPTHGPEASSDAARSAEQGAEGGESYPGTGWGRRVGDRAVVVDFDAAVWPAEQIALRYEYRAGLRALGILPDADDWYRLHQRERGEPGFAPPPQDR